MLMVNQLCGFGAGGAYYAPGVAFGGSAYMARGANLSGAVSSKTLTVSFWLRKQGSDGALERIMFATTTVGGTTRRLAINKLADNSISLQTVDSAGTNVVAIGSSINVAEVADGWVHFITSFDASDAGKRHLLINGVSDLAVISNYTNATIDYSGLNDWSVGAQVDGTQKTQSDLADIILWTGIYVDLSVATNLALFRSGGRPVDLTRAVATLGAPNLLLRGPASQFNVNQSLGSFTVSGTLTDTGSPSA